MEQFVIFTVVEGEKVYIFTKNQFVEACEKS